MKKLIYILPLLMLITGCRPEETEIVEFADFGEYQDFCNDINMFAPKRVETLDLNESMPHFTMPDTGLTLDSTVTPQIKKVTSVTVTQYAKEMLSTTYCSKIHQIAGTYWSLDENKDTIQLSGKIIFPANQTIRNIILVTHFTVTSDYEAPSRSFPLEGLLATDGYALIIPDYIGYGVTKHKVHPYMALELTQRNCCDMLYAGINYLKKIGRAPMDTSIYIVGYSQGGANAIACADAIEKSYYNKNTKIKKCFAGGGPYDLAATYDKWVSEETVSYPVGVPLVLMGLNEGCKLNLNYNDFFTPEFQARIPALINSKLYTTNQINHEIGTNQMDKILTKTAMDKRTDCTSPLYKAMMENSVAQECDPVCPCYIFHSIDDNVVPYINAQIAKYEWSGLNMEYNFGHYGNHQTGYLKFILIVKKMLQ